MCIILWLCDVAWPPRTKRQCISIDLIMVMRVRVSFCSHIYWSISSKIPWNLKSNTINRMMKISFKKFRRDTLMLLHVCKQYVFSSNYRLYFVYESVIFFFLLRSSRRFSPSSDLNINFHINWLVVISSKHKQFLLNIFNLVLIFVGWSRKKKLKKKNGISDSD